MTQSSSRQKCTLSISLFVIACITGATLILLLEKEGRSITNPLRRYVDDGVPAGHVNEMFLQHSSITDDDLQFLDCYPRVTFLRLSDTRLHGQGLQHLNVLKSLQILDLDNIGFGDHGFRYMACSSDLRQLTINNELRQFGKLTDRSAAVFATFTALEIVDVSYNDIGVETCRALGKCPLRKIFCRNCYMVDDASIRELAQASTIQVLSLEGTAVSDSGMVELRRIRSLRQLNLCRTAISSDSVGILTAMPSLERLDIRETRLTQSDISRLRAALPLCEILSE